MGWESISMGLNAQGEVLNNSYWTSAPEDGAMLWPQFAEGNISGSMTLYASELQYGDSTNGLVYDDNGHTLYVYYNGQQVAYFGLDAYDEWISYLIFFGIDEENQVGSIWIAERRMTDRWGYTIAGGRVLSGSCVQIYNTNLAYNIIKRIMPLVGATIKVNYYLPDYDYTYAKITYKQDSEPASEIDGESVEILKDETSVNIEGLEEEKTYYFKIFTDKSESEAFPYTVEVDPVPPEYKTYIDNINGTGFDWIRELEQDTATITNSDRSTFTADMYKYYPMNKVTWYTHSHQGTDVEYWNKTTFAGQTTALFVSSKIDKVEINSNNNVYSCTITKNNENSVTSPDRMFVYEKTITMGGVYTKDTLPRGWYANFNYHSGYLAYGPNCNPFYLAGSWKTRTFSGTLTEVFEQLQRYVRNIDIYVDGVLWSKAGK